MGEGSKDGGEGKEGRSGFVVLEALFKKIQMMNIKLNIIGNVF